jgi:hypothetical protein
MATYRFIWLDEKKNITKSRHIDCVADDPVIEIARQQIGDYEVVEVWDGTRPVCRCGNPGKIQND